MAVSVQVVSGEDLAALNKTQIAQLTRLVPSLTYATGTSDAGQSIVVRGVGTQTFRTRHHLTSKNLEATLRHRHPRSCRSTRSVQAPSGYRCSPLAGILNASQFLSLFLELAVE
mgnify:CR=1 FL=1